MSRLGRVRQFRIMISETEHAELMKLSEWLRVSAADVARQAIHDLYLQQSYLIERKG